MSLYPSPLLAVWSWTAVDVVNHLWQSTAVALALLVLMALCRRLSARTRLALGWMALLKFALPLAFFAGLVTAIGGTPEDWLQSHTVTVPSAYVEVAAAPVVPFVTTPSVEAATPTPRSMSEPAPASVEPAAPTAVARSINVRLVLAGAWFAGFSALVVPWLVRGLRFRRMIFANSAPVSPEAAKRIRAVAARVGVWNLPRCIRVQAGYGPGLLGVWSPVLIVPEGLESSLTRDELESVLLHEFIHLRRRDSFWGALQVFAVGMLWFNPVVWIISRWIRLETEKACDEQVLAIMHDPDTYARGILKVVRHSLGLPEPLLVSATTPPVVSRISNILRHGTRRDYPVLRLAVLAGGAALIALGGHAGSLAIAAVTPAPSVNVVPTAANVPGTDIFENRDSGGSPVLWGQLLAQSPVSTAVLAPPAAATPKNPFLEAGSAITQKEYEPNALAGIVNPLITRSDRDFARGERLFKDIGCAMCHAFAGSAVGIGPDLTGIGGRFGVREILESVLDPSAVISDLYGMQEIILKNGTRDRGKIVSENNTELGIVRSYSIDPATKSAFWGNNPVKIQNSDVVRIEWSQTSIMPAGAINGLKEDEIADLVAYLISAGDRTNRIFRNFQPATPTAPAAVPAVLPATPPTPSSSNQSIPGWDGATVYRGPITTTTPTPIYQYNEQRGSFEVSDFTSGAAPVLASAAVPSAAAPSSAPAVAPAVRVGAAGTTGALGRNTVTIDFPDEDIRTLLLSISELFDLNITLPEAPLGRTSTKLRDVTWQQIFTTVLEPTDYTFRMEGNIVRVVRKDAPVEVPAVPVTTNIGPANPRTLSVDFPNGDIRTIILNIAELYDLNIVVPETLQGRTSIKLRDVTWQQIYTTLLDPVGYTFVQQGNIIKVVQKPSVTVVFPLKKARAADVELSLRNWTASAAATDPNLTVAADARTNSLVVWGAPATIDKIRTKLVELDIEPTATPPSK